MITEQQAAGAIVKKLLPLVDDARYFLMHAMHKSSNEAADTVRQLVNAILKDREMRDVGR